MDLGVAVPTRYLQRPRLPFAELGLGCDWSWRSSTWKGWQRSETSANQWHLFCSGGLSHIKTQQVGSRSLERKTDLQNGEVRQIWNIFCHIKAIPSSKFNWCLIPVLQAQNSAGWARRSRQACWCHWQHLNGPHPGMENICCLTPRIRRKQMRLKVVTDVLNHLPKIDDQLERLSTTKTATKTPIEHWASFNFKFAHPRSSWLIIILPSLRNLLWRLPLQIRRRRSSRAPCHSQHLKGEHSQSPQPQGGHRKKGFIWTHCKTFIVERCAHEARLTNGDLSCPCRRVSGWTWPVKHGQAGAFPAGFCSFCSFWSLLWLPIVVTWKIASDQTAVGRLQAVWRPRRASRTNASWSSSHWSRSHCDFGSTNLHFASHSSP